MRRALLLEDNKQN